MRKWLKYTQGLIGRKINCNCDDNESVLAKNALQLERKGNWRSRLLGSTDWEWKGSRTLVELREQLKNGYNRILFSAGKFKTKIDLQVAL